MTIEKYADMIIRNIKCSKGKRMEIKKQLLSDISAALDHGETLEQIIERMGSAKEAAQEFNQNLSAEELKRFSKIKKRKVLAVVIVVIIIVLCFVFWMLPKSFDIENSKIFDAAAVETQARQVVDLINAEDYSALQEISTEAMQPAMTKALLSSVREQIADDWGVLEKYGNIYMAEVRQRGQVYAVAEVSVSYEYANVTYLISFNPQMELAGLYMR